MKLSELRWTREPESYKINGDTVEIVTKPHTDLWQRTYYHFQNDNAPNEAVGIAVDKGTGELQNKRGYGGDRDETPYGFVAENVLSFSER